MANGARQQESLKILKLINAASSALRLYPEQTVKVSDSIENAYQGTKSYLRENTLLRLSYLNGVAMLNGEPVGRRESEQLQLLTLNDHLQKMGLHELVLSKGFDRKAFKKMLSVLSVTPEQVNASGGIRSFVGQQGLAAVFPEKYVAPGESEEEQQQKKIIEKVLNELSGGVVRPECVHFLVGKQKGEKAQAVFLEHFQSLETAAHSIATTTYSLLHMLRKDHVVVVSSVFSQMLVKIDSFFDEADTDRRQEYAEKAAALLSPHLEEASVLMLICQDFPTQFGAYYYRSLVGFIGSATMTRVVEWMKGQQQKTGNTESGMNVQLKVVASSYGRLLKTPRGKQIQAMGTTRDVLAKTERGRKEQRLHTGIVALAKGDMKSLENEEVCLSLPSTILKLLVNGKESLAAAILQNIVSGLKEKDNVLRIRFGQIVGGVAEKLALLKRWDWLEKLTPVCLAWIRESDTADRSFEKHVIAMQAMMNHAWKSEDTVMAERILSVFHQIRSGAMGKTDTIQKVVAHVQEKNVDMESLQVSLAACLAESFDEGLCEIITWQGPVATKLLLQELLLAEKRPDRMRLLKTLSGVGTELVPVLLEKLSDPMPWYGKRNLIRLLGETGSEKNVAVVLDYIGHEHLRVQQEALKCIVQLGGESTEKYLLLVLSSASVQVKSEVVTNLRTTASEAVVAPLAEILEDCKLYSGSEKDRLVLEICKTLDKNGSEKALRALRTVVNGGKKQFGKEGVDAAKRFVSGNQQQGLSEKIVVGGPQDDGGQDYLQVKGSVSVETAPVAPIESYECITEYPEEKEVYALLNKNNRDDAKKKLLQLIEQTAQQHKFVDAEALRLRLIDIDSMALSEIIQAAEYIEEVKSSSIDQDHVLIWSELYDLFSGEESSAFFHSLERENLSKDTIIARQGDVQPHLFLVNKGRVKLFFKEDDNEVLVQTLSAGEVYGGNTIFDDFVWTLNALCLEDVDLFLLSRENIDAWQEDYPALAGKVQDYCLRVDRVNDFFTVSGADRRASERYTLSVPVSIELLDADEEGDIADLTIRGEGSSLSIGGTSFLSKMVRGKDGKALLGQHVRTFIQEKNKENSQVSIIGTIVAVRNIHSVELGHAIHIRFDTELKPDELEKIIDVAS